MKMKYLISFLISFLVSTALVAQSTNATLNEDYYHWLSRYEIKAGRIAPEWFTTVKPVKRNMLVGVWLREQIDHELSFASTGRTAY